MATNNPMAIFDPNQMPAHVKAAQQSGASNIVTRQQVDALTFPGKVWTVNIGGAKRPLMRTTQDGEEELVQTINVAIIAYNENRGREFYASQTYDPNNPAAPVCWSNDGVTSAPESSERQSEKCNVCPQAIKGSRQTDQGKPAAACRVHRHLAVIPIRDLNSPVLRLKIPQTSDFDGLNKEAQAKGLFAFTNYLNLLKSKGVPMTYSLVTKISFDQTKPYPKLWFSPSRWLTDDEEAACKELAAAPTLGDLLKTDWSGFGTTQRPPGVTEEDEAEDEDEDEDAEVVQAIAPPAPSKPAASPKPTPAPTQAQAPKPAPAPAATATNGKGKTAAQKKADAAAAAAAQRKAAVLVDEDDEVIEVPAPAAKPAAVPATAAGSPALDKILTDWDDE